MRIQFECVTLTYAKNLAMIQLANGNGTSVQIAIPGSVGPTIFFPGKTYNLEITESEVLN
jgi:hypothetical protein